MDVQKKEVIVIRDFDFEKPLDELIDGLSKLRTLYSLDPQIYDKLYFEENSLGGEYRCYDLVGVRNETEVERQLREKTYEDYVKTKKRQIFEEARRFGLEVKGLGW